jgi:ribosomal protein L39E
LLLDLNIETRRASWREKIITTLAKALRASREVPLWEISPKSGRMIDRRRSAFRLPSFVI